MSNSLDPDQARRIVGPDLGPNCLPRLSADDTSRQKVNKFTKHRMYIIMYFCVCIAVSVSLSVYLRDILTHQ